MKSILSVLGISLLALGCGGDDDDDANAPDGGAGSAADSGAASDAAAAEDLDMQATDFDCILDGTKVHKFFVKNPLGKLDEAVAVASSASGGTYPVGTILQLVPQEAMVKRRPGWSPSTNDWEFFSLAISAQGETTISARGTEDVVNAFNGNCFDCHSKAEPAWDLVCEETHGCDPLEISDEIIETLQNGDSRCQ